MQLQSSVMGISAKSASSSPRNSSGQIVFDFFDHSFFFKEKKKKHTALQIAKVYPVLHKKETGEHLSMLDYIAELK